MSQRDTEVERLAQKIYFKVKEMQRIAEQDTETILCVDAIHKEITTALKDAEARGAREERERLDAVVLNVFGNYEVEYKLWCEVIK